MTESMSSKTRHPKSSPDLNDTVHAARNLLGWKLVHATPAGRIAGYIVETEAYPDQDPASHAFRGPSTRNAAMFEDKGTIYMYRIYGMHLCFNIVTGKPGVGEAVLVRALQPAEGIDLMKRNRGLDAEQKLTNGPANLVQALGMQQDYTGTKLSEAHVYLEPGFVPEEIIQTTRIGITKAAEQPWRFYIGGSSYVSKR